MIFVKEEATGLVFNGQDGGRNFNVVSVASGSEANEHSELVRDVMLACRSHTVDPAQPC